MAYVAAYLKAAPGEAIDSEPFFALGTMAERLAKRASSRRAKTEDAEIAAHLEVAASLGVAIRGVEREGRMLLCYDGEAFRRVLALPAPDEQRARAALALTRPECIAPNLTPAARYDLDAWRADVLAHAPREHLPEFLKNRLRLRNAGIQASFAFQRTRRGEDAQATMELALAEFAAVNRTELAEEDAGAYAEAAVRVGASRWAATPAIPAPRTLAVTLAAGEPGQTCITLVDAARKPLAQRCTYATVWAQSVAPNAAGTALALAVQPLAGWRELWVFRKVQDEWRVDVLPPGNDEPDVGYVEFAGWVPGKMQMLAAREAKTEGKFRRTFEVIDLATLAVEKRADDPASLSVFYRAQDAGWKKLTVALR
jgi:hypothetical protein